MKKFIITDLAKGNATITADQVLEIGGNSGGTEQESFNRIFSATYSELGITPESTIEEKQIAISTFLEGYDNVETDNLFFEIKEDVELPTNLGEPYMIVQWQGSVNIGIDQRTEQVNENHYEYEMYGVYNSSFGRQFISTEEFSIAVRRDEQDGDFNRILQPIKIESITHTTIEPIHTVTLYDSSLGNEGIYTDYKLMHYGVYVENALPGQTIYDVFDLTVRSEYDNKLYNVKCIINLSVI